MPPDPPKKRASERALPLNPASFGGPDEIQDAYLKRAIAEMGHLNDEIAADEECGAGTLPVLSSGAPRSEVMLIKWAPSAAEQQEGVAFFGRAGTAILKSCERLGIDPLALYGTLCVKCLDQEAERAAAERPRWLERELMIVAPRILVVMGERVIEALNGLEHPMSDTLAPEPGRIQRWTPSVGAIFTPDIDESLDEEAAKRAFWTAFRVLGDWHRDQPPF